MHVSASNNLTIDLIRQQRFDVAYPRLADIDCIRHDEPLPRACDDPNRRVVDRVELSPEALAYERWRPGPVADQSANATQSATPQHESSVTHSADPEPSKITPVVGSPALAGLGVALVVPGTLLDVFA